MAKKEITEEEEEEKIDTQIIDLLMKKGIKTAPENSKELNQMYGKVVQRLLDEEFNEFMEYEKGSHVNKKDNNRRNGSTSKGKKEVLGLWIDTTESASKWCEIFEELKSRGVEDIFLFQWMGLQDYQKQLKVYIHKQ